MVIVSTVNAQVIGHACFDQLWSFTAYSSVCLYPERMH